MTPSKIEKELEVKVSQLRLAILVVKGTPSFWELLTNLT